MRELREVVVTGIGLHSCLGTLYQTWESLLAGKSGIQIQQPFSTLSPRPLGLLHSTPTFLASLTESVVTMALQDAGLKTPLGDCGVVIGSSRGCQANWEVLARERYSVELSEKETIVIPHKNDSIYGSGSILLPSREKLDSRRDILDSSSDSLNSGSETLDSHSEILDSHSDQDGRTTEIHNTLENWLNLLPNAGAIITARQIGSESAMLAPMAACATGIWSLAQGYELIQTGQCDRVIAGAVEAPITPLTLAGFSKMGALAKTGAYPFDKDREGLVLGEGGAIFVLESAELAHRRGASIYGKILGFGLTCDAYHISAPESRGKTSKIAIKQCLERSQLLPQNIDYIHAHGTSTKLNDAHEAQLIQHLFPANIPISSTKGATGHTLGASGAMGVAFCLLALKHQILPPCIGLNTPEFDLNFVTVADFQKVENALCFSFGFGGQNAIVGLGKG